MDLDILLFVNGFAGHIAGLDAAIAAFSQYGPLLFVAYPLAICFREPSGTKRVQNRRAALGALVAAVLSVLIDQFIGAAWPRSRPFVDHPVLQLVSAAHNASFPSNHAAAAFAIAAALLLTRRPGGNFFAVLAAVLSLSRLYVGVHYPSDLIGGMLIGLASAFAAVSFLKRMVQQANPPQDTLDNAS